MYWNWLIIYIKLLPICIHNIYIIGIVILDMIMGIIMIMGIKVKIINIVRVNK